MLPTAPDRSCHAIGAASPGSPMACAFVAKHARERLAALRMKGSVPLAAGSGYAIDEKPV
jgi:hypothetical protein